jgi:S-adenosyl methyltransferase
VTERSAGLPAAQPDRPSAQPAPARLGSKVGASFSVAGIHNVLLGGRERGFPDRDAAGGLLRILPSAVTAAHQNRRFVESAVQFMIAMSGIRQFIDIGCGLPAPGSVSETALGMVPDAPVVCVDRDRTVVKEMGASLAGSLGAAAIRGDLRRPDHILSDPALLSLIDMTEPVGIFMTAVLEYVADEDDPGGILEAFTSAVAPGSHLVLSHAASDHISAAAAEYARRIFETAESPFVPRGHARVTGFFDGLQLVAPGVVNGATWRPGYQTADPRRASFFAGLGQKR